MRSRYFSVALREIPFHCRSQRLLLVDFPLVLILLLVPIRMNRAAAWSDWPAWRGANGNGITDETNVPVRWSATENIAWSVSVPGSGWSSPVVTGQRVVVTSATADDQARRVLCFDTDDGQLMWNTVVHHGAVGQSHRQNSAASSTPATDGHYIVAAFVDDVEMTVACVSMDGELIWTVSPGSFFSNHGFAASPVMYRNGVIVNGHQDGKAFVVMLDKNSGTEIWRYKPAVDLRSFSTPVITQYEGQDQMILTGASQTVALNPENGELIWFAQGPSEKFVSTPSVGHGLVFSFGGSNEKKSMAVRLGGTGDVTESHIAWRADRAMPYVPTPLLAGDYLHIVSDMGVYSCLDAKTGKTISQSRSLGSVYSSPVMVENRIYLFEDSGACSVIQNEPGFRLIARNELGESTFCTPAVAQHSLFVRTNEHLIRIH